MGCGASTSPKYQAVDEPSCAVSHAGHVNSESSAEVCPVNTSSTASTVAKHGDLLDSAASERAPVRGSKRAFTWQEDAIVGPLLQLAEELAGAPSGESSPCSPLRTKSYAESVADSTYQYAQPSQTLIFVDWDDTVFPTTELFTRWAYSYNAELWGSLTVKEKEQASLAEWSEAVYAYLTTACNISARVVVVTNATRPWVNQCIDAFAPRLNSLFDRGLRVAYAKEELPKRLTKRADFTDEEYAVHLTKAKYLAMRREAREFYSQYTDQTWKNIISVGDARYEHDAIQDVAFHRKSPEREHIRLKILTTPCEPSISDLTYRLRLATVLFPAYVQHDGDIDLNLNTPERLQAIADALDMPEIHGMIRQTSPIHEGDEYWLSDKLDELTMIVHDKIS